MRRTLSHFRHFASVRRIIEFKFSRYCHITQNQNKVDKICHFLLGSSCVHGPLPLHGRQDGTMWDGTDAAEIEIEKILCIFRIFCDVIE